MEKKSANGFLGLFLYGGSKDERSRGLYDRVGYYSGIFLFMGLLAEIFVKSYAFDAGLRDMFPELTILILDSILTTILYVWFGISIFENSRQKRLLRVSFTILGMVVVSIVGYAALWLKLPAARKALELGPIAWLIPPVLGTVGVIAIWCFMNMVSLLANKRSKKMEGME